MDESTEHRAAELAALLARHYPLASPYEVATAVREMQKAARNAKRFAEDCCNYDMSEERIAARQRRQNEAESRINARLAFACLCDPGFGDDTYERHNNPATIRLGGDPRGPCAYLMVPGVKGDGWDSERGWGVW